MTTLRNLVVSVFAAALLAACSSNSATQPATPAPQASIIRIKAGNAAPFTDSAGHVWSPETGFEGGESFTRDADLKILNTNDPNLYRTEHWGMDTITVAVPNGKYTVKLYFAETYEGITGPGQRVFSFDVQGHRFNDFDIWVKAGGIYKPYIETIKDVEIKDGKLRITLTPTIQSTEINALEIIPQ